MTSRLAPGPDAGNSERILDAALRAFARKGYHGSTIREIAEGAGVSVAGLYHHFPSKGALLTQILDGTMDRLIAVTEAALDGAGREPADRLRAAVSAHVTFHIDFQRESFVGNSETRSLVGADRARVVAKRHHQRALFEAIVSSGLDRGVFSVPFPIEASRGLVTMCTAVATWYRRDGGLHPEEIVARYCALALYLVGHDDLGRS